VSLGFCIRILDGLEGSISFRLGNDATRELWRGDSPPMEKALALAFSYRLARSSLTSPRLVSFPTTSPKSPSSPLDTGLAGAIVALSSPKNPGLTSPSSRLQLRPSTESTQRLQVCGPLRSHSPAKHTAGSCLRHEIRAAFPYRERESLGRSGATRLIWMLTSPPCAGCTTHTGCEEIPDTAGASLDDLDNIAPVRQLETETALTQSHGAGDISSHRAFPEPRPAGLAVWPLGATDWYACWKAAGHPPSMETIAQRLSSSPHAIVNSLRLLMLALSSDRLRALIDLPFLYPRPPRLCHQATLQMQISDRQKSVVHAPKPSERNSAPMNHKVEPVFGTQTSRSASTRKGQAMPAASEDWQRQYHSRCGVQGRR
jgi:hypothetical protein